jgi:hypothetical protein
MLGFADLMPDCWLWAPLGGRKEGGEGNKDKERESQKQFEFQVLTAVDITPCSLVVSAATFRRNILPPCSGSSLRIEWNGMNQSCNRVASASLPRLSLQHCDSVALRYGWWCDRHWVMQLYRNDKYSHTGYPWSVCLLLVQSADWVIGRPNIVSSPSLAFQVTLAVSCREWTRLGEAMAREYGP